VDEQLTDVDPPKPDIETADAAGVGAPLMR
jgi:hypothetical protein